VSEQTFNKGIPNIQETIGYGFLISHNSRQPHFILTFALILDLIM